MPRAANTAQIALRLAPVPGAAASAAMIALRMSRNDGSGGESRMPSVTMRSATGEPTAVRRSKRVWAQISPSEWTSGRTPDSQQTWPKSAYVKPPGPVSTPPGQAAPPPLGGQSIGWERMELGTPSVDSPMLISPLAAGAGVYAAGAGGPSAVGRAVHRLEADGVGDAVAVLAHVDLATRGRVGFEALVHEEVHPVPVAPGLAHGARLRRGHGTEAVAGHEPVRQAVRVLVVDDASVIVAVDPAERVGGVRCVMEQVHLHQR